MKKTSLLLGTLLLQLTASYGQQTKPSKNALRTKALLESRINDIRNVRNSVKLRDGDETPLAQGRRIIQQEYFYSTGMSVADLFVNYGYSSATKGQEFHPNMILGFPMNIGVSEKQDHVFFPDNVFASSMGFPQFSFPAHELATEIVIDTLSLYEDGDLTHSITAERDANNRIDVLTKTENYNSGQDITKSEKFYTNDLLTKVDEYYGENLSTMELESRRLITYDNNEKVTTDTLFYYYQGALDGTLTFVYTYNGNGDVSEITLSSDYGDSAHVTVGYYTDNRFKNYEISLYSAGDLLERYNDSIGYAANGFIGYRQLGMGSYNGTNTIDLEYNILNMTYNGNLLDSVKATYISETGQVTDEGFAKYHYSIDNNPDSLMVYYETGMPAEEKMIFHYEPYNTTSVKQITRNNNFNIYPNPIGNTINIYNKVTLKDRKATIMITDIKGSRIWSVEQALVQGNNQINTPAGLSAGVYVITITADNSVYTQKVVKQ